MQRVGRSRIERIDWETKCGLMFGDNVLGMVCSQSVASEAVASNYGSLRTLGGFVLSYNCVPGATGNMEVSAVALNSTVA